MTTNNQDLSERQSLLERQLLFAGVLLLFAGTSFGAITIPTELDSVWTDLATAVGLLLGSAATLFGVIRGSTAILKVASRFFSAAGA